MRALGGMATSLTILGVLACSDSRTTEVQRERLLLPSTAPAAQWYPTDANGAPDYGAVAKVYDEYARPSITGSAPSFLAKVDAGFTFVGTAGELDIAVNLYRNNHQSVPTQPVFLPIPSGSASPKSYATTWQQMVTADCGVEMDGYAVFASWFESNGYRWGRTDPYIPFVSKSSAQCVAPSVRNNAWVEFGPYAVEFGVSETRYREGETVAVTGSVDSPGTGTLVGKWWELDGAVIGNNNSVNVQITTGYHTLSFNAQNSVGLKTSVPFTYTGVSETCDPLYDPDPSDPYYVPDPSSSNCTSGSGSGGGGSTPSNCRMEYVYIDINYWDGTGWHEIWEGYATVCG